MVDRIWKYHRNLCWLPSLPKMETCIRHRRKQYFCTCYLQGWDRIDQEFPFLDCFRSFSKRISDSFFCSWKLAIPDVDTLRLHMPLLHHEIHRDSLFITCSFPGLRPFAGRWQHYIHEWGSEEGTRTGRARLLGTFASFAISHWGRYARWSYCKDR